MKYWAIALVVLTILVISGGCSSSAPEVSAALAPATDTSGSGTRTASALNWGSPIVLNDQAPQHDVSKSLAIIAGNPAVSYIVWSDQGPQTGFTVYFQRADDPAGTSWGSPNAVAFWPFPNTYSVFSSLCEVNGKPAISYQAFPNGAAYCDLRFVRAKDPTGRNWGTPIIVDPYDETLFDFKGSAAFMKVVNGNPAIWYTATGSGKYVRALDPNGSNWDTPTDCPYYYGSGSVTIVNGHPAMTFVTGGDLHFVRAADANGFSWVNPPQTVLTDSGPYDQNRLIVVGGYPAIAFSGKKATFPESGVRFIRALDADGTNWPAVAVDVTVSSENSNDWLGEVAVVNGLPSIAFVRGFNIAENPPPPAYDESYLSFVQAVDPDGSDWETAQTIVNLGGVRSDPVLAETESGAGIAFLDNWHVMNYVGAIPVPDPAVNVQLSTDKSNYIIGEDTDAVLTAVVNDEYGDPIGGLGAGAFATTLDGSGVLVTFGESATAGTYTGSLDISGLGPGSYNLETTATDTRDVSGSDSATFAMNEHGAGGTMHVGDLDASADPGRHGWWRATFTVKIDDDSENPAGSADVSFSFSGADNGNGQVTTGGDGTAAYQTGWIKNSGSVTFTVDDVTHATLSYSAADNHDPDGDSDGTSITVGP
jgi:hypothetical protein